MRRAMTRDEAIELLSGRLADAAGPEDEAQLLRAAAMMHGEDEMGALPDPDGAMHRKIARAYELCRRTILQAEREYIAATKRPGFIAAERAYRLATKRAEVKR